MKVLYISSNHSRNATLMVEHEITELQRDTMYGAGRRLEFVFLPALPFEDVENQILVHRPDIVHISAHGEQDSLELVDTKGNPRKLNADGLRVLLAPSPPRVVYLNACDSAAIAEEITDVVPYAIGTNAPITNFAARKGAVALYRAIAQGRPLTSAFNSSRSVVRTLGDIETSLFPVAQRELTGPVLYEPTRIVAHFKGHNTQTGDGGSFWFEIGVAGCPASTIQTIFTTTDRSYLSDDEDDLEGDLSSIKLDTPWKGEVWLDDAWSSWGDIQLFALLITAAGEHLSVSSTLSDALTAFYEVYHATNAVNFPPSLVESLSILRANDGSRMRPMDGGASGEKKIKKTARLKPKTRK